METDRPAVNAGGDGQFKSDRFCSLLDALVAMRWDLNQWLRAGPDPPPTLTLHLARVGSELDGAINALKILIGEAGNMKHNPANNPPRQPPRA
jgi:hypothetical protein